MAGLFHHLLVPLDGSHLAEAALPAAAYLAQAFHAQVTLIHVIERDAPTEVHSERHLREAAEAEAYLADIAQRAFPPETPVEWHVHTSPIDDVANSIVQHSAELAPDLVVMCTHGRSGPRDWLFGSIAQQVIAARKTPVLLIPAHVEEQINLACGRILVPLDGNAEHEQGLPYASGWAQNCGAALYLLMVVPTLGTLKGENAAAGKMLPGSMTALLDIALDSGKEYLSQHILHLREEGVEVQAEIGRGDPVPVIVSTAQRVEADLIVFGTHGKAGLDAFWSGSITPQVSSRVHVPLLLVPVREI